MTERFETAIDNHIAESVRDDEAYMSEHHQITETAIGLARLHLKDGDPGKALAALEHYCGKLDEITIKFQPATARLMDLIKTAPKLLTAQVIKGQRVKYIPDHAHGNPDDPACKLGCIKSWATQMRDDDYLACFVLYDNLDTKMITGDEPYTAKRTRLENLTPINDLENASAK